MLKKYIAIAIAIVVLIFVIIRLMPNEKKRVANDIRALQRAVQDERRADVLLYLDPAYKDDKGMDYDVFVTTVDNLFAAAETIQVSLNNMKITIDSTSAARAVFATCSLGLRVTARYEGETALIYGSVIQPSPVVGYFRKQEKVYRLYTAKY